MTFFEFLIRTLILIFFAVIGGLLFASITVFPMMANYHECGTIFLCGRQP